MYEMVVSSQYMYDVCRFESHIACHEDKVEINMATKKKTLRINS